MAQHKYMFIYHSPVQTVERVPSPEELQQMFAQWDAWKAKFQKNILDLGDGLKSGGKILANGAVTDGPFPETKDLVAGYSIVQAESYEDALRVARECPMAFVPGAKIQIRQLARFG